MAQAPRRLVGEQVRVLAAPAAETPITSRVVVALVKEEVGALAYRTVLVLELASATQPMRRMALV
jgi:hypothetical protein